MPVDPLNFRLVGIEGRVRQNLVQSPRIDNHALIHIEDFGPGSSDFPFERNHLLLNGLRGPKAVITGNATAPPFSATQARLRRAAGAGPFFGEIGSYSLVHFRWPVFAWPVSAAPKT